MTSVTQMSNVLEDASPIWNRLAVLWNITIYACLVDFFRIILRFTHFKGTGISDWTYFLWPTDGATGELLGREMRLSRDLKFGNRAEKALAGIEYVSNLRRKRNNIQDEVCNIGKASHRMKDCYYVYPQDGGLHVKLYRIRHDSNKILHYNCNNICIITWYVMHLHCSLLKVLFK